MKKVDIHQLEGQDSLGTVLELLDIIQQGWYYNWIFSAYGSSSGTT